MASVPFELIDVFIAEKVEEFECPTLGVFVFFGGFLRCVATKIRWSLAFASVHEPDRVGIVFLSVDNPP